MTAATARTGPARGRSTVTPVVTGIGVVAPNGVGTAEYWTATLRGRSGLGRISRFDPAGYSTRIAGEVDAAVGERLSGRMLPQTDHMTRLSLLASDEALADAHADPANMAEYAAGVVTAASGGGFEFGQKELQALWSQGGSYVSAYQSFAWFYPVNTGQIAIRHGMRGPGSALVAEQAGGLDAVAKARRRVRDGTALMLTGGVDGSLCPWSLLCMTRSGRLSRTEDPKLAYRPFDLRADGYVPGEGGALLVIEDPVAARERGVTDPYGEIAGYAATFDPAPGRGGEPGLRRAIETALADAGIGPAEVDVVFADAVGEPESDRLEAETLAAVFGPRGVPVTAPKTMTGRLLGGGAALDLATALLAIRDSVIPPTIHNGHNSFAEAIDLVTDSPRQANLRTALVVARGYRGHNSALVVRTADEFRKGTQS
ncbi:ketosynthase chain-length factor [Amycolatopsis silviterrae]|uniref:Ketosynthase chain-length factor n=1 Tax=Amycolatopsis silviterrae TaxID=1656914 RepID=A0ABW5H6V8_9PSEU